MNNNRRAISLLRIIKNPVISFFEIIINNFKNVRSAYYLKKIAERKHDQERPARVAFIVQMPEIWDKEERVYNRMALDDRFKVDLIVVPPFDIVEKRVKVNYEGNYFLEKYPEAIRAYENKKWMQLSEEYDYVFYQRPYDEYLPKDLKSDKVVTLAKCCYIPYATPEAKNTKIYAKAFFRNLYFGFLDSSDAIKQSESVFKNNCNKGIQHFLNIGYPAFETCLRIKKEGSFKKILWTPRWSYNTRTGGGSHFFEYNDRLTEFDWQDNCFVVRPHPMMWDNFLAEHLITMERKEEIIRSWEAHNIELDGNAFIEETFQDTGFLISDRSSVIPLFFLTGRPVIYCPYPINYGELFATILPGLYVANNWQDLRAKIEMLQSGNDPLKRKRLQIINENFSHHFFATENIVNMVLTDFAQ